MTAALLLKEGSPQMVQLAAMPVVLLMAALHLDAAAGEHSCSAWNL
jgi:hypothetical protein